MATRKERETGNEMKHQHVTHDAAGTYVVTARPAPEAEAVVSGSVLRPLLHGDPQQAGGKQLPSGPGVAEATDKFLAKLDEREDIQEILRRLAQ